MADHLHRDRLLGVEHQLRAFGQYLLRVARPESDQLLAILAQAVGAVHAAPADPGERLAAAHRPAHVEIVRGDRGIGVLADDDEALLGAQDVHGLGAVGRQAVLRAVLGERFEHAHGVVGLDVHLVAQLAGEGDAEHPRRHPGDLAFLPGHEGEGILVQVDVGDFGEQLAAVRAGQGEGRVVVGDRGEVHLQLRPFGLVVQLQPLQYAGGAAGGGGHDEVVVGQAGGHAVVEDHPVFLAHQAVARLADVELGPGVGVDPVEELPRVRALDVDLAQGRGVEQADRLAHRAAFAGHGGVHVLAAARKYHGRFHWPTSSNSAPFFTCQACRAVKRTGSNRCPQWRPATAPKVTGVKFGRNMVVPVSAMLLPWARAAIARPLMLPSLPWSVPKPSAV